VAAKLAAVMALAALSGGINGSGGKAGGIDGSGGKDASGGIVWRQSLGTWRQSWRH